VLDVEMDRFLLLMDLAATYADMRKKAEAARG
jgi:hypothetical protein